jgi:uncharacterized protein
MVTTQPQLKSAASLGEVAAHDIISTTMEDVYVADGNLGKGLFAAKKIKKGRVICVFQGEIIDFHAAVAKGEKQCYPLQIDANRYVDLVDPGCFANHSCEPNAAVRNDFELVALFDIPEHAEIRYDYSTTMDEDFFTMPCRCGSPICRGVVTDFKFLPSELQRQYLKHGLVMSFIARKFSD